MSSSPRIAVAGGATFLAAVALSIAVALDDVLPGELRLLREVQAWDFLGGAFADVVRFITTTQVVAVTGVVLMIVLWLLGERRAAVTIAVALVLLEVAQPLLKDVIDRPRPSDAVVDIRGSITSPSFPAGHVMSPAVLYGALAAFAFRRTAWPRVLRFLLVAWWGVLLPATSLVNLYLGVHWPSDVLGGLLWGAVVVFTAFAIARLLLLERWLDRANRR